VRSSAIRTAERKEFKGNTMEGRQYDREVKAALRAKGMTDGMFSSSSGPTSKKDE
jgi:hypothetical protein